MKETYLGNLVDNALTLKLYQAIGILGLQGVDIRDVVYFGGTYKTLLIFYRDKVVIYHLCDKELYEGCYGRYVSNKSSYDCEVRDWQALYMVSKLGNIELHSICMKKVEGMYESFKSALKILDSIQDIYVNTWIRYPCRGDLNIVTFFSNLQFVQIA